MSIIHLFDGGKGGVGKTFAACVFIQFCRDRHFPYVLVETDHLNPGAKRLYPDNAQSAAFSEDDNKAHEADIIFELARQFDNVIVNLPAQVTVPLWNWIERGRLLEIGEDYGIKLRDWFVSDGSHDSISLFKESLHKFGQKMEFVFVRNLGRTPDWSFLDKDEEFVALKEQYKCRLKVIDLPLLWSGDRYYIERNQLNFERAKQDEKMLILSKQRLQTFLDDACAQIEKTGSCHWAQKVEDVPESEESTAKKRGRKKKEAEAEPVAAS